MSERHGDEYSAVAGPYYDLAYAKLRDPSGDAAFYLDLARQARGPVLELGSRNVESQIACLSRVRRHLLHGGAFAFDVFAPRLERIAALRLRLERDGGCGADRLGGCPRNALLRAGDALAASGMLGRALKRGTLRSPDPNRLCGVALLRLRTVFLRSRSRVGLAALATGLTRTGS